MKFVIIAILIAVNWCNADLILTSDVVFQPGGTGNTITVGATSPSTNLRYTLPDSPLDAEFVMTTGGQIIDGTKTFMAEAYFRGIIHIQDSLNDQTRFSIVGGPGPIQNRQLNLPDVADGTFLIDSGDQHIIGTKSFGVAPVLTDISDQLMFRPTGFGYTLAINVAEPDDDYTLTLPNVDGTLIASEGSQTINGQITFTAPMIIKSQVSVIQSIDINNGVTCHSSSCKIRTVSSTLGALGSARFTVTNSLSTNTSVISADINGYLGSHGTDGLPMVNVDSIQNGMFDVIVINGHTTNALNGVLYIGVIIS